jgi:hypothetical protein
MILFDKSKYSRMKYKFNSSELIERNYSQAYQDMFVLTMLNGKRNGTYLEVGAMNPIFINNTYLLETKYDWTGVSIDINNENFSNTRKNTFVQSDALKIDYESFLEQNFINKQIDYLSLDIEPKLQTLEFLKLFPHDKYRFSVITYETDYYDKSEGGEVAEIARNESRKILLSLGYKLVVGNVANVGPNGQNDLSPFEDWYIDPEVVDLNIFNLIKNSLDFNKSGEDVLLNN